MKMHTLKSILIPALLLLGSTFLQAQFDDVYFDPDNVHYNHNTHHQTNPSSSASTNDYGVTYYDNDDYQYYDDYDGTSPSGVSLHFGIGFFTPFFGFSYYDPYWSNSYWGYYPYSNWYGCNSWGYYYPYNNWYAYPSYYYGYGGCGNYYGYNGYGGGYYNNYWGGCNSYYGGGYPTCGGGYPGYYPDYHPDYHPDHYYGPRTSGNTGSSPRGPIQPPGITQPVLEGRDLADQLDKPASPDAPGNPGVHNPSPPVVNGVDENPASLPLSRDGAVAQVNKDIPVDKELKHDPVPGPKRPVFKPAPSSFEPYPTHKTPDEPVASTDIKPAIDRPVYKPYIPERKSTPVNSDQPSPKTDTDQSNYSPPRDDQKPGYKPNDSGRNDRPSYTPPSRVDDRPSYHPAPRNTDSGNNDSGRSNDRPSYSPPPRSHQSESNDSPAGHSRSYDSGSGNNNRSESPSHGSSSRDSSSGSNHSSSGNSGSGHSSGSSSSGHSSGSSSSGSSPRGKG